METKDIDNSNRTGTNNNGSDRRGSVGSFATLGSVPGGGGNNGRHNNRRYSYNNAAQSSTVSNSGISISSASVFAPSVYSPHTNNANTTSSGIAAPGGNNNNNNKYELQPSSARLLQQWNKSANSSLLSSLGTAASKTFRSYKMTLPRFVPPPQLPYGNVGGEMTNTNDATAAAAPPVESDLELLGRTVHAVSSALTEPPKEGDKYMIYDVSFNPRGCVWDALIVVQISNEDGENSNDADDLISGHSSTSNTASTISKVKGGGIDSSNNNMTFTFPIRVTCAEDDDDDDDESDDNNSSSAPSNSSSLSQQQQQQQQNLSKTRKKKRAKTYAVDVSIIDDSPSHPISRWTINEQSERRDDMKNAMEWISYTIRRSMARSMFPKFPEGCQGKPFRDIYQLNKKLKSGTFSTVCRGVHRLTGRQVAVKCILRKKIEPSVDAAVFEEVLIMSGLHHKYICPMIDYFEEDRCHFVVMELERGGDLCERLNEKVTYSEDDARKVARNICEAMDFVHTRGFAHCDIKPRNYLLRSKNDDVDVRLADFGFAQHVHAPNSLTSQCGTPFFVAPEVINRKPYDQKVDMWSIGVTTYLLLCGDTPFNGKNRQQLFRRISCDEPPYADDKWGHISNEGIDFVQKLLMKDPAKRMSAAQALSHRWLMKGNKEQPLPMAVQSQSLHPQSKTLPQAPSVVANVETRPKSVSTSRGPTYSVSVSRSREESEGRVKDTTMKRTISREPSNRSNASNRSNKTPPPTRSVERASASRRNNSKSRERTSAAAGGQPPPPPLPSKGQTPLFSSSVTPNMMEGSVEDVNARLLDVIRVQDAKIEQLERLLKRMLDHEDEVHKC
jgi:serine/threonine protein kinase